MGDEADKIRLESLVVALGTNSWKVESAPERK